MANHQIVCTNRASSGHGHIISVGTGTDPAIAAEKVDVATVRSHLRAGDRYYTVSLTTGKTADVEPYDCACGVKTIRTRPDQVKDDNLDNLRACRW